MLLDQLQETMRCYYASKVPMVPDQADIVGLLTESLRKGQQRLVLFPSEREGAASLTDVYNWLVAEGLMVGFSKEFLQVQLPMRSACEFRPAQR